MISRFLLCGLLVHVTFGQKEYVRVNEQYKGKECVRRLEQKDYYAYIHNVPLEKEANGNPNYLWGATSDKSKVLYCARITAVDKPSKSFDYKLPIPGHVLGGQVHAIQALDMNWPNKGGDVILQVKSRYLYLATLYFFSNKYNSMDYIITVFGQPPNIDI